MFSIIYRFKIKAGKEKDFQKYWAIVTEEFRDLHGGLGSCLHLTNDGIYLAYARWPSREDFEKDKKFKNKHALEEMKKCVDKRLPSTPLEVVNDLLV